MPSKKNLKRQVRALKNRNRDLRAGIDRAVARAEDAVTDLESLRDTEDTVAPALTTDGGWNNDGPYPIREGGRALGKSIIGNVTVNVAPGVDAVEVGRQAVQNMMVTGEAWLRQHETGVDVVDDEAPINPVCGMRGCTLGHDALVAVDPGDPDAQPVVAERGEDGRLHMLRGAARREEHPGGCCDQPSQVGTDEAEHGEWDKEQQRYADGCKSEDAAHEAEPDATVQAAVFAETMDDAFKGLIDIPEVTVRRGGMAFSGGWCAPAGMVYDLFSEGRPLTKKQKRRLKKQRAAAKKRRKALKRKRDRELLAAVKTIAEAFASPERNDDYDY